MKSIKTPFHTELLPELWDIIGEYTTSTYRQVDTIYSSRFAFAAKRTDGNVVTWGRSVPWWRQSESTTSVTERRHNLYSTDRAFTAKRAQMGMSSHGLK